MGEFVLHFFDKNNVKRHIKGIAVILLSLTLILLSACNKNESVNKKKRTSSINPNSTSSNNDAKSNDPDDCESTKYDNDDSCLSQTTLDEKISGDYSVESNVDLPRSDLNEVKFVYNDNKVCNDKTGTPQKSIINDKILEKRTQIMNTQDASYDSSKGNVYYISPGGNDNNDGRSPETAVRSLDSIILDSGDTVLFERNSVFRISEPISVVVPNVSYGAYGKGEKPAIYGSPNNYAKKSFWKPTNKKNVWRVDFPYKIAGNIVFNHGEDCGVRKKSGLNQLTENGQFYHNVADSYLYLYFDKGNPADYYSDIEICPESSIFSIASEVSNIKIDNITMKYTGFLGVDCKNANNNITITNCIVAWIGGSGSNPRWGNGVQWWNGSHDNTVKNCWFYQIFDTAITPQGYTGNDYYNFNFADNLIEYCCCGVELWDNGSQGNGKISSFKNIVIENNIMRACAYGFGNRLYDDGIRGIEGHIRFGTAGKKFNISILNNIFDTSFCSSINWYDSSSKDGIFTVKGNSIYQNSAHYTVTSDVSFNSKEFFVKNQAELEEAWRFFDTAPGVIKWLG